MNFYYYYEIIYFVCPIPLSNFSICFLFFIYASLFVWIPNQVNNLKLQCMDNITLSMSVCTTSVVLDIVLIAGLHRNTLSPNYGIYSLNFFLSMASPSLPFSRIHREGAYEERLLFADKSHPDWWHEFCHSCSPERCHKSNASNKTFVHLSRWHVEWDKSSEALHFFLLIFLCLTICRIFSLFMVRGCAEPLCAHFFAGFDLFSLLWMCVRWSNWYNRTTTNYRERHSTVLRAIVTRGSKREFPKLLALPPSKLAWPHQGTIWGVQQYLQHVASNKWRS